MIRDDAQLKKAQEAARNLELILERARKVHNPDEYIAMSKPILIELQQRENEIIRDGSFSDNLL